VFYLVLCSLTFLLLPCHILCRVSFICADTSFLFCEYCGLLIRDFNSICSNPRMFCCGYLLQLVSLFDSHGIVIVLSYKDFRFPLSFVRDCTFIFYLIVCIRCDLNTKLLFCLGFSIRRVWLKF